MEKKEKSVSSITRTGVQTKLASFVIRDLADDLYYLYEVYQLLRADVGDSFLEEHYGKESWEHEKKKLLKLKVLLNKVKVYYDSLEDKKWKEDKKELEIKKIYVRALSKIPLIESSLYKVVSILLNNTKMKYMTLRTEHLRAVQREHKTIDMIKDMKEPIKTEDEK